MRRSIMLALWTLALCASAFAGDMDNPSVTTTSFLQYLASLLGLS